jgi:hypothetical protein
MKLFIIEHPVLWNSELGHWISSTLSHGLCKTNVCTIKHAQSSSHAGRDSTDIEITKLHTMQTWMRKIRYRIRNSTQVKISTGMKVCSKVRPFLKPKIELSQRTARKFLCVQHIMCTIDGQPKDSYWYTLSSCCPVFARALWRANLSLSKSLTKNLKNKIQKLGKKRRQWMTVLNPLYSMKHTSKHSTLNVYRTPSARFPSSCLPFKQEGPLWQQNMSK